LEGATSSSGILELGIASTASRSSTATPSGECTSKETQSGASFSTFGGAASVRSVNSTRADGIRRTPFPFPQQSAPLRKAMAMMEEPPRRRKPSAQATTTALALAPISASALLSGWGMGASALDVVVVLV